MEALTLARMQFEAHMSLHILFPTTASYTTALGIARQTLYDKLRKFGVAADEFSYSNTST